MDKLLVLLCKMPQQQYTFDQLISMACSRIAELEHRIAVLEETLKWR